jgi:hypothetical protein
LVVFISAFMAFDPSENEKRAALQAALVRRYLRARGEKSSKSGRFVTGKIIP